VSAAAEHARALTKGAIRIGYMLEDIERGDRVQRSLRKCQLREVLAPQRPRPAMAGKPQPQVETLAP
jgi:hypothetical protein